MRKTADILDIPVDSITMEEAVSRVLSFIKENRAHCIYTPNAEIIMAAHTDANLKNILKQSDLLVADGAGVVLASKILGVSLPEKVSGIDLVKNLFAVSRNTPLKFFFFGSKPGTADAAAKAITSQYENVQIVGCRNGYFSAEDEKHIIDEINASGADILLVALGAPKQEIWIHKHKDVLKVKVCIGVGGSLDVFAGNVSLAPEFMRRAGLEWLFRLYKEPWRYKRMMQLPKFVLTVIGERIKGK